MTNIDYLIKQMYGDFRDEKVAILITDNVLWKETDYEQIP